MSAVPRLWLAIAAATLAVSSACALALVAARVPGLAGLFGPTAFRQALVLHVDFSLLFWLLAGASLVWSLEPRAPRGGTALVALLLCTVGSLLALAAPYFGGVAVLSNYVPVIDSGLFVAALGLFALGVGVAAVAGIIAGVASESRWAMFAYLASLAAVVPGLLVADAPYPAARYEAMFWAPGHLLQFVYALVLMRLWQMLAGDRKDEEPAARACFAGTAAFAVAGALLAVATDSADAAMRRAYTILMAAGTWPGPLLLLVLLLRRSARFAAVLAPSAALYFAGVALGIAITGNNSTVPAHYHATVGAVTLALMSVSPLLARSCGLVWPAGRVARWQPVIYAVGAALMIAGLFAAGLADTPRKGLWVGSSWLALAPFAVGGALAVAAALAYCVLAFRALLGTRERHARRRDLRWAAAVGVMVAVAGIGGLIAAWPDAAQKLDPRARHAREMALREIAERFSQGTLMLHAKRYDHALVAFHRVLELDPALPEAHVNAGFALVGLTRFAEARDFFAGAIELRPMQVNAYYGLAVANEGLGDLAAARGAMRTYAHLAPRNDPFRRKAEAALWEWESAQSRKRE